MDYSLILEQLVTVEQAHRLIIDLENLTSSLYMKKRIDYRLYPGLIKLMERNDKKDCIKKLIETIKKLPIININLSFYPNFETVEKISDWLEENLGKKVLISVKNKQELFTKVELEFNGKYGKY